MILLRWLITTLAVFALPYFVHGVGVNSIVTAIIVGACLVFVDMVIKPIVKILTLPINILTLGLFALILNGVFFWVISLVITGFTVKTITAAIIGALVISIINWIVRRFVKHDDK